MAYIKADNETTQEMFDYLEDLRQSGETNMFGAAPYLEQEFSISHKDAGKVLTDWMEAHSDSSRILSRSTTGTKAGRMVTRYEPAED